MFWGWKFFPKTHYTKEERGFLPKILSQTPARIQETRGDFTADFLIKDQYTFKDTKKEFSGQQLPSWYIKKIAGPFLVTGFGIFPVFVDGKIMSMIYVDWEEKTPNPDQNTLRDIQGG